MNTKQRAQKIRRKIKNKSNRPRLSVFRSNKFIYAQVIDDAKGHTVAAASDKSAKIVGERIAKQALAAKVTEVYFDRGGYKYHGRVKELAEAAREAGLKF